MKSILFKKGYLYLILFLLIIAVAGEIIVQNRNDASILDTQKLVDHTYKVLNESNIIQGLSKDVQGHSWGYVVTNDPYFSTLAKNDANAIVKHLDTLFALTNDNSQQQLRIDSLYDLVKERVRLSQAVIDEKESKGILAASQLISRGEGIATSQKISDIIQKIQEEETYLLGVRKAANTRSIGKFKTYLFIPFLFITAALIILIVFILMKSNAGLQKLVLEQSTEIEKRAKKFEALLENSFEGIFLLDRNLNYTYLGFAAEKVTGYSLEDQMSSKKSIELIHPDDQSNFNKTLQEALNNPGQSFQILYRTLHKKGHYVWIEAIITNRLDNKNVEAIVFNVRDVTAKVEMELQRDDFLTMVSHELRTPVTSLKVLGQILHDKFFAKKEEESMVLISKLNEQTNKLMKLISELIELNKLSYSQLQYTQEFFRLDVLVCDVIDDLNRITLTHKITSGRFEAVEIFADKQRIVQVVTNLIINAIKYSPRANEVVVDLHTEKDNVIFSIKDEGIGIDISESEKIFQRFYRSKRDNVQTYPGLGIGLYVSMEIIKAHHGKIWVESTPGKGSVFYFSIPLPSKEKLATILN